MLVKPADFNNLAVYGRTSYPPTWFKALWHRKLRWFVLRDFYFYPMLFLYKCGLAWWPEGSRVSWRDIGKYPDNPHAYTVWRFRRFTQRKRWLQWEADYEIPHLPRGQSRAMVRNKILDELQSALESEFSKEHGDG